MVTELLSPRRICCLLCLLFASLIVAAAFGLYLKYLIASALEAPVAKKKPVVTTQSKAA